MNDNNQPDSNPSSSDPSSHPDSGTVFSDETLEYMQQQSKLQNTNGFLREALDRNCSYLDYEPANYGDIGEQDLSAEANHVEYQFDMLVATDRPVIDEEETERTGHLCWLIP